MRTETLAAPNTLMVGSLAVTPFAHPQGCRSYLVADPATRRALAIDPHLDAVEAMADAIARDRLDLLDVVDTHTHADHPSGARALAERFGARQLGHADAVLAGVTRRLQDGDELHLGDVRLVARHAPGHTPDHLVLVGDGVLFSGDTLLIGGVARTDFLGGDAGALFDTLRDLLSTLPDDTQVFPAHDYRGRISSRLGDEKATNPWLRIGDRAAFVKALTANPPPRPANMDALLRLNREGVDIPPHVPVRRAIELARAGGAGSIVDVRTAVEVRSERVPGSRHVPLDRVAELADEVRETAAPRLLMCRTGMRAESARAALEALGVRGLQVIEGGMEAWRAAGGPTERERSVMSLERQVRIAAGALVVLGALLAIASPWFVLLCAFVGAGLVFSGVTDRCGMALVLARLPWNAEAPATCSSGAATGTCAAGAPPAAAGCSAGLPPAVAGCSAGPPPAVAGCAAGPPPA